MPTAIKPRTRPTRAVARVVLRAGSQEALAARLGVSQASVSKYATGRVPVPPLTAIALEKAFPETVTRADLRPDLWG